MRFSTVLSGTALFARLSTAGYVLEDDYMQDFFGAFDFFTGEDPTKGFVNFVDQATAESTGLINTTYATSGTDGVMWGVDSTNQTPEGRPSLRLESKKHYNTGLVVLDVEHMPVGCGTWPAFWMLGPNWPDKGEIDIIEGVNEQEKNHMTLHTGPGCAISSSSGGAFAGEVVTPNCDVAALNQSKNAGCSIAHPSEQSFGVGLNENKGGVYATQWANDHISVYFFPRGEIPDDVLGDSPDPTQWGTPAAKFSGRCDIEKTFEDQKLIFDTTFCGDWAGNVWEDGSCAKKAATCEEYVRDNPEAFTEAFWTIKALKVYQDNGEAPAPSSSEYPVLPVPTNATVGVPIPSATGILTSEIAPLPSSTLAPAVSFTSEYSALEPSDIVSSTELAETGIPTSETAVLPSSTLAPAISFTSAYSALEPSDVVSSSAFVSSAASATPIQSDEATPSNTVAPVQPTGGADNGPRGPMGGFKWPGEKQNGGEQNEGDGDVSIAPVLSTRTVASSSSALLANGTAAVFALATGDESAVPPESEVSTASSVPSATSVAPAPSGEGGASNGPMPGFQWPSGGEQRKPSNTSTAVPIATTSAPVTTSVPINTAPVPSGIETDVPSASTSADPSASASMATVSAPAVTAPAGEEPASAAPTPTKSCSRSSTITEVEIALPTGGRTETVVETVYVTVDSLPEETGVPEVPTPALRMARKAREARRRITRHHAKA